MEEFKTVVFKKYAMFDGRSRRREFWMFVLFNFLISIGLSIVESVTGLNITKNMGTFTYETGVLTSLYSLAVLVPSIAVTVRRLHDTNHSGWWWFMWLIPVVGWIVLLVFLCRDSDAGDNRYGQNPKGMPAMPAPAPSPVA